MVNTVRTIAPIGKNSERGNLDPIAAKVGGLRPYYGVDDEAAVTFCEPLTIASMGRRAWDMEPFYLTTYQLEDA